MGINFENILKTNSFNANQNDTIDSVYGRQTQITLNDYNSIFFNESKMKQKLKREWITIGNRFQGENEVDFIDNSIEILKESKYYLNSSNILPNIEMNQYNTYNTKDFLPAINKKDNFYKSQMNSNNITKNSSQIGFIDSNSNFYINENPKFLNNNNNYNNNNNNNKKNQKLNFNSIYPYNLKSESDLIDKIRTKDKENFMNNNNNNNNNNINNNSNSNYNNNNNNNNNSYNAYNNSYQKIPKNSNFFDTVNNLYDYSNNIRMKQNSHLYNNNNNNIHQSNNNTNTYSNEQQLNYNNSLGFKFNNSSYNNSNNVNLSFVKVDTYDLGVVLLYCILGGFDLIDLSSYECKHTRSDNCCCLLHCYYKYEKENNKNSKIKLKTILKKYTASLNFEKFICALTSFKIDKNLSIDNLKQHFWLNGVKKKSKNNFDERTKVNFDNFNADNENKQYISENLLIEMKEIFKLSNEINSSGSIVSVVNNKKKFEIFITNFGKIISKSHYYFKQYNIKTFNQIINRNNHVDFISKELNLEEEFVYLKLKELYDNYFLNENVSQNENDESKNFN